MSDMRKCPACGEMLVNGYGAKLLDENAQLKAELAEARSELLESARLHGMGSEREAALMARLAECKKERGRLRFAAQEAVLALQQAKRREMESSGSSEEYHQYASALIELLVALGR